MLLGLVEIKKRVGPYHKFIIPLVVSTLWVMVIIPYVVAIPLISALLDNTSEEYATFVKYAIAVTGLFVVITTTTFAVIVNTFLQRVEEEKLAKFIIKHLKRILAKNAILTDDLPLSRLYNTFLRIGEKPLEKWLLRDRRPVLT